MKLKPEVKEDGVAKEVWYALGVLQACPREHGAWGILAIPLITGTGIGWMRSQRPWPSLLFAVAALAIFCLRTPVESLLGNTPMRVQTQAERRLVTNCLFAFATIAAAALAFLIWGGRNRGLLLIGAVAVLLFVSQMLLQKAGRGMRMAAQFVGALGLTSTAAGAYYVTAGRMDACVPVLWIVNWMFAANQVHFVQLRIHGARLRTWNEKCASGWPFLAGQSVTMLVLVGAWCFEVLPGWAVLAFLPVFVRGVAWFVARPQPLRVRRLGFVELAHAVVFGVLLIIGFVL
jgi:hypothetical protein